LPPALPPQLPLRRNGIPPVRRTTTQVECHRGYELTEKDRNDMARLHAATGVPLPEEYLRGQAR
jgi:hypothetical protein